ncbi:hypothetical protein AS181_02530 [Gordonia sp. SGD-V-85]|nr:hypothetical protein AS181_02530 [Gordonia sp. SGD-V-85]
MLARWRFGDVVGGLDDRHEETAALDHIGAVHQAGRYVDARGRLDLIDLVPERDLVDQTVERQQDVDLRAVVHVRLAVVT